MRAVGYVIPTWMGGGSIPHRAGTAGAAGAIERAPAVQRSHIILNVDDNEVVRYARSRILRHAGCEVIEAVGSADALRRVRMERPALVLLDV